LPVSFFSTDTATTVIYTLSLHDALPIFVVVDAGAAAGVAPVAGVAVAVAAATVAAAAALGTVPPDEAVEGRDGQRAVRPALDDGDRKSTRLNSSHRTISYAVFCLKKKKK